MNWVPSSKSELVTRLWSVLVGAVGIFEPAIACASDPWVELNPRAADVIGTLSCASASCHGSPQARGTEGAASRQAHVHWLGGEPKYQAGRRGYDPRARIEKASGDPHALAAQRMQQPPFQEVLRRYGQRADGSMDASAALRCAKCHDPASGGVPGPNTETLTAALSEREREPAASRGIGCESCHGAARQWVAVHYQRDISREQLTQLGMIDTKNLFVRARLCASCHVGSADNDMNHDMIAAGHPPLRFELASYEALIEHKHWDDRPRRLANPDYEVQLWAAGRVAAAEAALALLEGRALRAEAEGPGARGQGTQGGGRGPWPELAESNCFACHQPLRAIANRTDTVLADRRPGVAAWQSWNLAFAPKIVAGGELATSPPAGSASPADRFPTALTQLRAAMERSFEPAAEEIVRLAAESRRALRAAVHVDRDGQILGQEGQLLSIWALLDSMPKAQMPISWDETCQQAVALAAVLRSRAEAAPGEKLRMAAAGRERLLLVGRSLSFMNSDRQWPAAWPQVSTAGTSAATVATMDQVRLELDALRRELLTSDPDLIPQLP